MSGKVFLPVPAASWIRGYNRQWLRRRSGRRIDGGCSAIHGLCGHRRPAPRYRLYTALVPLVVYAVMGTSRPLSVTTALDHCFADRWHVTPGRAWRLQ
jgi:sulfate permease, SulP family